SADRELALAALLECVGNPRGNGAAQLERDERKQRDTWQEPKRGPRQREYRDCDRGDEDEVEGRGQKHRHMVGGQPERLRSSAPASSGIAAARSCKATSAGRAATGSPVARRAARTTVESVR